MPPADLVADRAAEYARKGTDFGRGMCLRFSRTCAGALSGTYNAITAWRNAKTHHPGVPPRGAMAFWEGGSAGHGHVAVSDGRGFVWSTDIKRPGKVDRVSIAFVGAQWTSLRYLGWTEDINGVAINGLHPAPAPPPAVQAGDVQPGKRNAAIKLVQLELRRRGYGKLNPSGATGFYGSETKAMVQAFQSTWSKQADGLVGPVTLSKLF